MEEVSVLLSDWQLLELSHTAGTRLLALFATGCLLLVRWACTVFNSDPGLNLFSPMYLLSLHPGLNLLLYLEIHR